MERLFLLQKKNNVNMNVLEAAWKTNLEVRQRGIGKI